MVPCRPSPAGTFSTWTPRARGPNVSDRRWHGAKAGGGVVNPLSPAAHLPVACRTPAVTGAARPSALIRPPDRHVPSRSLPASVTFMSLLPGAQPFAELAAPSGLALIIPPGRGLPHMSHRDILFHKARFLLLSPFDQSGLELPPHTPARGRRQRPARHQAVPGQTAGLDVGRAVTSARLRLLRTIRSGAESPRILLDREIPGPRPQLRGTRRWRTGTPPPCGP